MSADSIPTTLDVCLDYASEMSEFVCLYGWSFQRALANILIQAANKGNILGPDEIVSIITFAREMIADNDADESDFCTHRD